MKLTCENQKCLCHWLCPSSHFIVNNSNSLTGCTYLPSIPRHFPLEEGKTFEICQCNGLCSGCRSAGLVNIRVKNGQPILEQRLDQ